MSFNIYTEAKNYFEELLDQYEGTNKASVTLYELIEDNGYKNEYSYSVYTSTLFAAISEDLNILGYAEEMEQDFGQGIATQPMIINEAIFRYIQDEYGNKTAEYFDIEAYDEEEEGY